MTLGELGERMSAQEFDLWWSLHMQDPIGSLRSDLHTGLVAATVANMAGKTLKGKPMCAGDFMLFNRKAEVEPDPAEHFGAM
jgi:hypothetical protein